MKRERTFGTPIHCKHFGYALALSAFLAFCSVGPFASAQTATDYLVEADRLRMRGDLEAAERAYQKSLALDANLLSAYNWLGWIAARRQRYQDALKAFDAASQLHPHDTFASLWRGIILLRLERIEPALQVFQRLVETEPRNHKAHYFLGFIHIFHDDYSAAIREFETAEELDPNEPEALCRLARVYRDIGLVHSAILLYQRAIARERNYIDAYNELGWIYYNIGYREEAMGLWLDSLRINPEQFTAKENLAKAYNQTALDSYQQGDIGTARRNWQRALEYQPDNRAAIYYLKKL